jgi:hypothetical protein
MQQEVAQHLRNQIPSLELNQLAELNNVEGKV